MAKSGKVIITCAVTGAIHTPSMSAHLPITAAEIEEAAVGAIEAGAAIVHLHARNPADGRPSQSVDLFRPFVGAIKARTNGIINLTSGGAPTMTVEERLHPMLAKYKTFKHDWEPAYLEGTRDVVFRNTFKDIEYILSSCADNGTRFEHECYDTAHLYNLAHFVDRGLVKAPFFVQTVFGILGGIGTHPDDVMHMKRTADRLFGQDYVWSVLGAGRFQMPIAAMSAAMGGNVRVGLEDSLWDGPGRLAETNAAQVRRVRTLLEGLSLSVATPDEARAMLALKGGNNVGF